MESGGPKPWTHEHWDRVDGKKFVRPTSDRRAARPRDVKRERMQLLPFPRGCPPGQPARIRPAVGLGRYFPDPAAVPTDPDGLLQGVLPAEVRAALYRALATIPEVTVVQGATDAAGRRGVALARAAAIEGAGSSGWLRLEIILDRDTYRYLGTRTVVTRDHFIPDGGGPRGTRFRKGQVLVSRAQLALAVVDAPCQRPGETTTCASYVETTWVGG